MAVLLVCPAVAFLYWLDTHGELEPLSDTDLRRTELTTTIRPSSTDPGPLRSGSRQQYRRSEPLVPPGRTSRSLRVRESFLPQARQAAVKSCFRYSMTKTRLA